MPDLDLETLETMVDTAKELTVHDAFLKIAELAADGWDYYNWTDYYNIIKTVKYLINGGKTVQIYYLKFSNEYLIFTKEVK